MRAFEFYAGGKIVAGEGSCAKLAVELEDLGVHRVLFLTSPGLKKRGLCDVALDSLRRGASDATGMTDDDAVGAPGMGAMSDGAISYVLFDQVPQDSSVTVVDQLVHLFEDEGCDGIVALGGGSVIDTAKSVAISLRYSVDDFLALQGSEMLHRDMVPLVAIPTTSGTGSEVTCVAVVADHEAHKKLSFTSYKLVPHVAIVDPLLTRSLPPSLTCTTGMDALCHAVEGYVSAQRNPVSDAFSHAAVKLIGADIVRACEDAGDVDARANLAVGALLAGISFSNAMVGIVHSIGHTLGGMYGIPHGQAMMMLLPAGCRMNLSHGVRGYGDLLIDLDEQLYLQTPPDRRDEAFIDAVERLEHVFEERFGAKLHLRDFGITEDQLPAIAHAARYDGSAVYNPVEVTEQDCLTILRQIY